MYFWQNMETKEVRKLERVFMGVNGKAVCVQSPNIQELGLTYDDLVKKGYIPEETDPSKMILVEGIYPDLPLPDTTYFHAIDPMEDLPPIGGFHS